jgi:hypothetical protein
MQAANWISAQVPQLPGSWLEWLQALSLTRLESCLEMPA